MPRLRHPSIAAPLLVGLALLSAGCSPEAPPPEPPPRVVASHVIQANGGDGVTRLSGRVKAAERTALSFEIPGEIKTLPVDVGDTFAAGATLATLEDTRYRLVVQQRRAALQEAEATLAEKRQDYRRQASLAEQGYVSDTRLDTARAALDTAESRRASAQAAVALAERDLHLTTLRAPYAGSVSRRQAEPAERVAANQTVLEVISDREGFEVETSVPETLVGSLKEGSLHEIQLPALGGASSPATLRRLGTQPRSSNDYPVILAVDDPPAGLRSGMTAHVALSLPATDGDAGLPVPLTALVQDGKDSSHVLRIDDDHRLERVDVEVLRLENGQARVRGALAPGERIVARGAEFVSAGQAVSLLGEGPERYN